MQNSEMLGVLKGLLGDNADEKCAFLIRLVEGKSSGQYFLQTGRERKN